MWVPHPHVFPVLLFCGVMLYIARRLNPIVQFKALLRNTLFAPFAPVSFRDALVGDLLTSLPLAFVDLAYSLSFSFYWLATLFSPRGRYPSLHPSLPPPLPSSCSSPIDLSLYHH
ncbi:EXS domaina containing protein [Nannochloropsis gaditana]|uniref:EXS domaina containing protein n=1 Tax=Nannochloropsis gaditana TaxID=72520 RepID=W7TRP9_9STRA|nr:EXS domaina containing protein [Nannochloropsis gaditana]